MGTKIIVYTTTTKQKAYQPRQSIEYAAMLRNKLKSKYMFQAYTVKEYIYTCNMDLNNRTKTKLRTKIINSKIYEYQHIPDIC